MKDNPVNAPRSGGPVDPAAIDDLVAANHILADQGVLDGEVAHGGSVRRGADARLSSH